MEIGYQFPCKKLIGRRGFATAAPVDWKTIEFQITTNQLWVFGANLNLQVEICLSRVIVIFP